MRWPWQRREQETAPQPVVPARRDDAARVSPMGWAFLPPLQRQLGDMPLVARAESFPAQLPAWQNPSFTGTLAHRVSTDAPSGVIDGDGGGTGEPSVNSASPDLALLAPTPVRPPPVQRAVAQVSSTEDGSRAVHAPLTTAATTGLPVLAVQSYEAAPTPPSDSPSEVVADDVQAEGDASTPMLQRSTDAAAPGSAVASPIAPMSATGGARPSVGGRRLGLGAPLPALPLVSDVPPVQRIADVPPAVGSEGAEGYVEVDIPSRASRREEPAETAETAAEPDVPTLGPAPVRREEGLDAARTSDAAWTSDAAMSTPPAMPVAPVQRSLGDTGDTSAPETSESTADDSPPPGDTSAPTQSAEVHTDPARVHDVPSSESGDRHEDGGAPTPAGGSVQDRPVLAQRSLASAADSTSTTSLRPGPDPAHASDAVTPVRELRHPGGHPAVSADVPQLQRAAGGPSTDGAAGLTLQRSVESPSPVAAREEATLDFVPSDDRAADDAAAQTDSAADDAGAGGDSADETVLSSMQPLAIAPTRPMLGTAAPLGALATAPVQRAEDTTDVHGRPESHWSPPTLTRTPGHAPTATAPSSQVRSTRHPTQLPSLHGAAVGANLQRSVDVAHGSVARSSTMSSRRSSTVSPAQGSTGSPAQQLENASSALPLAAPSVGDEPAVQTSVVDDAEPDAAGVPAEAATVPAEAREAGGSASTSTSTGAAAPGGAAGASSPEQLEVLAGRLFAPLMRRIRSEMLLDRERRGLRTDSW